VQVEGTTTGQDTFKKSEGKYFVGIRLGKIDECEDRWCQQFVLACLSSAEKDDEFKRNLWQWALTM
jgi:hypothetical protein